MLCGVGQFFSTAHDNKKILLNPLKLFLVKKTVIRQIKSDKKER